ncbi:MAG: glycosyltransferase [Acidobacteriaceae bacterium]|nr:glycosyltransferase [Acidobacteriaceae bacterium]
MLLTHESERFRFVLETPSPVRLNARESYLKGWFAATCGADSQQLAVVVDGITTPVISGFSRTDVSSHLNDPKLRNCGFVARFNTPRWDRNLKVIWQTGSEIITLAHLKVDLEAAKPGSGTEERMSDYESWLILREPHLFWPEGEIFDRLAALPELPLISIILPTYNTPAYFLQRCVQSVLDQRYANWQLCAADDGSSDPDVLAYLQKIAAEDERVVISSGVPQSGISRASNRALSNARGEFVVLLDHDDELHPFALLEVVRYLNQAEGCDLLYSDEDKIDLYGHRSKPTFKPDFDPDIFLTFNYLGHLIALRRTVAVEVGGFRPSCDGAQDWDLLIRAVELIGPAAIHHLSKPLYHWRMHEESTSVNLLSKPYVRKAWVRVLSDHLDRTNQIADLEPGTFFGSMRLRRPVPEGTRVAVLVRAEDGEFQRIVLGKTLEPSGTALYIVRDYEVSRAVRYGSSDEAEPLSLGEIAADVFVFINRPLETVNQLFVEELAGQALREDCGVVTGISLNSEGKVLHTGLICSRDGSLVDPYAGMDLSGVSYMRQLGVPRAVETISDQFFAVRRGHLESSGGLSGISSTGMPRLLSELVKNARRQGLAVIVTPYAIATFVSGTAQLVPESMRAGRETLVCLNANLRAFEDFRNVS